jgi:hypothetical protein
VSLNSREAQRLRRIHSRCGRPSRSLNNRKRQPHNKVSKKAAAWVAPAE